MKKHRLIGLAALLALATSCGKDVADRISLFANSMGGAAKVWMDPANVWGIKRKVQCRKYILPKNQSVTEMAKKTKCTKWDKMRSEWGRNGGG